MKTIKKVVLVLIASISLSSCSIMSATWASNQEINDKIEGDNQESYAQLNDSASFNS